MAKSRESLSEKLKEILDSDKVYFSPPSRLSYPCVLYRLDDIYSRKADNIKYTKYMHYTITYVAYKVNEQVVNDILSLPMCSFDRSYVTDNLNHVVFSIYW